MGVAAVRLVLGIVGAGENDEGHVAQRHPQLSRERRPIDPWHLDVEDDHRGWIVRDGPHRLFAITRLDHAEPTLGENGSPSLEPRILIVDNEERTGETLTAHGETHITKRTARFTLF